MTLAQLEDNPPIIIDLDEQSSFITKIKNEPEVCYSVLLLVIYIYMFVCVCVCMCCVFYTLK